MKKKVLLSIFLSLFFFLPVQATVSHVLDRANLLKQDELVELEQLAKEFSQENKIGFYIRTLEDSDISSIEEVSQQIYHEEQLGASYQGEALGLILRMNDRSFDFFVHGEKSLRLFYDNRREEIMSHVVPYLKVKDYAGGFREFLNLSHQIIQQPEKALPKLKINPGHETSEISFLANPKAKAGIMVGLSLLFSSIFIYYLIRKNHSAEISLVAYEYTRGLELHHQSDQFMYTTEQVIHHPKHDDSNSSGGGFSSSSGGGFGHTSGHF